MSFLKDILIEKLNSNNYDIWKFKIEMYLQKEDLYSVISDDPPDQIDQAWRSKDRKARAIINLLIDDDQIIHVRNLQTARECMQALRAVHERSTLSSKLFLLRKLYSLKLPEGGNMTDHITKIYQTREKLIAIGEQINEQHLSALMLCSLPPSYDTLITALEARPENELTPDFIRSKLIDEFSKRVENVNECENTHSALKVKFQKPKMETNKFCRYCKKKSHNIDECWNLKNRNKIKYANNNYNNKNSKMSDKSAICFQDNKNSDSGNFSKNLREKPFATSGKPNGRNCTFFVGNYSGDSWVIDSGSSAHICNDKNKFNEFHNNVSSVTIANGQELNSLGYGSVKLNTVSDDNVNTTITLKNVLYVPEIETNLISIKKATENGCIAIFENQSCKLIYNGDTCLEGYVNNNLYECKINKHTVHTANLVSACENKNCLNKWHKKLGHRNVNHIRELVNKGMATGIEIDECKHNNECEICIVSKLAENPYPKAAKFRATRAIELVHTDLCGPMTTPTVGGKYYFLTFIDDFSRFTVIYLLKNKFEVFSKLKEYVAMTANKFGRKVQEIRSDNGGEYTGKEFDEFFKNEGINHQFTVPYSPSQNGVAERKNRTLIEMARCLLKEGNLPNSFWGEAICTATYIQNRLPTSSCDSTPYEKWTGCKPDLSNIKTFGCRAYAYVPKSHRGKLDNTAKEGIFVGYDNRSKGYRICTDGRKIVISRTVKFLENKNQGIIKDNVSHDVKENSICDNSLSKLQIIDTEINDTGNNTENQNENSDTSDETGNLPRRSERSNRGVPPDRFAFVINDVRITEPKSWDELENIQDPIEKANWINATKDEINSLNENKTWELVDAPPGKKIIGCKWAFKTKYDSNGQIQKYKARLVAKGFSQKFGIDYEETFAPVVSHTTIRTFLNMAVYKNLDLRHIDIKTAFLHGNLQEEVYMKQPEGYEKEGEENKVCRLKKAIYGLKQAARAWNIKITESLVKFGFQQSKIDKCLYKRVKDTNTTYIIVYVDDVLIAGNKTEINEIIAKLKSEYKITDLGELNYYLGINIKRPERGVMTLDQEHKINELVNKFNLADARPCDTPMDPGYVKTNDEENLLKNNTNYRQAVGSLLYISSITRPDITVAVNILSRRNENPRQKDWEAVKRVIKYLKSTKSFKLVIDNHQQPRLTVFADADYASDLTDRKSTSGILFKLGNNSINWLSKKQNSVSLSSAEAEYISAATASRETRWLITLLTEMDLHQKLPIDIFEDNQAVIKLTESEKNHSRTKHIDVKYHLIKDLHEKGVIKLNYIPSERMTADVLTKPLPKPEFRIHRRNLHLTDYDESCLRRDVGYEESRFTSTKHV